MRRWFSFAGLIGVALALSACSSIQRNPVPKESNLAVTAAGPGPVRLWGDAAPVMAAQIAAELVAQRRAAGLGSTENYLAISGGASDGAFGAGLLVGWTAAGNRPKFDIVTGVSTGAIIAPFAFLGSNYDQALTESFTGYKQGDIFQIRNVFSVLSEASLADTGPLIELISRTVTPEFMAAVAVEHKKGRRLLIGTTHLDAQRPVIWNMGEIAERGDGASLDLFRKIILASAAVPGVFPPVLIPVQYEGRSYDEMHVDGGVTNQVFIFPAQTKLSVLTRNSATRLFVIRNGRITPEWEAVDPNILKIAARSINSLTKYQGLGDLNRLYLQARNNNADFNLASIPEGFTDNEKEPFDSIYMRNLYQVGFELGRAGYRWQKAPPNFRDVAPPTPPRVRTPRTATLPAVRAPVVREAVALPR